MFTLHHGKAPSKTIILENTFYFFPNIFSKSKKCKYYDWGDIAPRAVWGLYIFGGVYIRIEIMMKLYTYIALPENNLLLMEEILRSPVDRLVVYPIIYSFF